MILRKPIKGKLRRSRDPALWVEHKQSKNNSSVYVKLHRVQVSKTDNNNDILLLSLPSRHRTKGLSFYVMISMEGYEPSKWAKSQSKNSLCIFGNVVLYFECRINEKALLQTAFFLAILPTGLW